MSILVVLVGVVLALAVAALALRLPGSIAKGLAALAALLILFGFFTAASIRYIGASEVGIVEKTAFGPRLSGGRIIATNGEMGTQADVLRAGWHLWYWPILYNIKTVPLTDIKPNEVGLVETTDGLPLDAGQLFAPEWTRVEGQFQAMLDAKTFLTTGKGRKGKQVSVLTPGQYPLNTSLYKVRAVSQTEVLAGEVAVLKANFGLPPSVIVHHVAAGAGERPQGEDDALKLAKGGEMGVVGDPLPPGKYPLNTEAFTVTEIWTTQMIAQFTAIQGATNGSRNFNQIAQQSTDNQGKSGKHDASLEEREITVRTADGFTFPVDVRVEYVIEPKDAPIVVAKLGDDEGDRFRNALNSAVRAIFRNNAEKVRALDYVQLRSTQESQSLGMLKEQMARFGITVTAVRIGNVGDELTLGLLLKTQTDREIAKQEQQTFGEQQKAAEKKKELTRVTQEAEEEKRLATAAYAVKIAEEDKRKQIIAAQAESESIKIKATAQSEAYRVIAQQIGPSNAAMIELLKIVGEKNIQITPRVMVTQHGGGGGGASSGPSALNTGSAETTALIGTMLDQMVSREDVKPAPTASEPAPVVPAPAPAAAPAKK